MSVASNNSILEFLDVSLHISEHSKISVDVYAKPNNSFTSVLPTKITCLYYIVILKSKIYFQKVVSILRIKEVKV